MGLEAVTYIEIDLNYCANTYGSAPCTASGSGDAKCFNTRNVLSDCQDTANFTAGTKTLRFGLEGVALPEEIDCIPNLLSASVSPAVVKPGESIGERATLTCTFKNHRHGDAGIDKYIVDRTYDPFDQGTFWGKFRARNPFIRFRPIRIIRGFVGQTLAEMETLHFVIDAMDGPNSNGQVRIKGVDFFRLLDDKTSMAPAAGQGYLASAITNVATSATLSPSGIGDSKYPASGKAAIGEEIVSYTRSADVVTITRAQEGTTAAAHDAEEVFQPILEYTSQKSSVIINDLITNYTPLDTSYTDVTAWNSLVTNYSDVLYSAKIVKPTPVSQLLNELVEQAGLILFADNKNKVVNFDVIRNKSTTGALIDDNKMRDGTFNQIDQPKKRYSQVWLFYYQKNYFKNLDEASNYYSGVVDIQTENLYETDSIKRIYSRWIPSGGRSIASDVTARLKALYQNPPRRFAFSLFTPHSVDLGEFIPVKNSRMENCAGVSTQATCIVTSVTSLPEGCNVEAEEYNFDSSTLSGDKIIQIDTDSENVNMRTLYDSLYASVDEVNDIIFVVSSGVVIGSANGSSYAMETGSWPVGATLFLSNDGYIVGAGGGGSSSPLNNASDGGDALYVTNAISVDNTNGVIGGGGGGGSGGYKSIPVPPYTITQPGGGGAGDRVGPRGGPDANDGTLTTGGAGYDAGGDGGNLGTAGNAGTGANPATAGAAGVAVDGDSLVTWLALGTISGSRIN